MDEVSERLRYRLRRYVHVDGQRFGRLVVLRFVPGGKRECRCDCGEIAIVPFRRLRNGETQSCGCLNRERSAAAHRTHGMCRTPEYNAWASMRQRCYDPSCVTYPHYGGRGIVVCERWLLFENFFADMGPRPSRRHSLDRKDVNGNYEPANCRWATRIEQARNRRNNTFVTFCGRTQSISAWAEELSISQYMIAKRLRRGWPPERALTEPSQSSARRQAAA